MRTFAATISTTAETKRWPKAVQQDFLTFTLMFAGHRETNKKDGLCFIPGELVGDKRLMGGVKRIDALVYDVDGTQTIEEATALIEASGYYAILYSSYNHLVTESRKKTDAYDTWARKNNAPTIPTSESFKRFLQDNNGAHYQNVDFNFDPEEMESKYRIQTDDGVYYKFGHDSVHKFRVVLPLKEPIYPPTLHPAQKRGIEQYKSIYHGAGIALGLKYDGACEDPSRLYYLPACPPGAEPVGVILNGPDLVQDAATGKYGFVPGFDFKLLDWTTVKRVDKKATTSSKAQSTPVPAPSRVIVDKNGDTIDLNRWEKRVGDTFDVEDLLQNKLPDEMLLAPRSGGEGFHVTCPYEANHTTPGGLGTYCVNGDAARPWTIHCSHQSCKDASGRKRLDYIAGYIQAGYIEVGDLEVTVAQANAAMAAMGIDPSTIPQEVIYTVESAVSVEQDLEQADADASNKETLSADQQRDVADVYDEVLQQLALCKRTEEAVFLLLRMINKGCQIELDDLADVIAASELRQIGIERMAAVYRKKTGQTFGDSFYDNITAARSDRHPIEDKFVALIQSKIEGRALAQALLKLAQFYIRPAEDIKKEYNDLREEKWNAEYNPMMVAKFAELTKRYAQVQIGPDRLWVDMIMSRKNNKPELLTPAALAMRYANQTVEVLGDKDGPTTLPLIDVWRKEDLQVQSFDGGLTFRPGIEGQREADRNSEFNMWNTSNPWGCFPKIGDPTPILKHIKEVWCCDDEKVYNWVMLFLADIFQNPGKKRSTAIVLLGQQGTGKSIPFEFGLSRMLGNTYGVSGDRKAVTNNFNSALNCKLLFLGEEILFAGDKLSMNALKDRVSRTTVDIEMKGREKYTTPSFTRYVFTSNQDHVLSLETKDRRFTVLRVSNRYMQNVAYFTELRDWLENKNGCEIWLEYLLNYKPEKHGQAWNDLYVPLDTEVKREQIAMSLEAGQQFFLELLEHGRITDVPSDKMDGYVISWPTNEHYDVPVGALKTAYENYLRYHSSHSSKFERAMYRSNFQKSLGMHYKDAIVTARHEGKPAKLVRLPSRIDAVKKAIDLGLFDKSMLQQVIDLPNSHLHSNGSDDVI